MSKGETAFEVGKAFYACKVRELEAKLFGLKWYQYEWLIVKEALEEATLKARQLQRREEYKVFIKPKVPPVI